MNVLNGALNVTGGGQVNGIYRAVDGVPFWTDTLGLGLPSDGSDFGAVAGTAVATVSGAGSAWNSLNALSLGLGGNGSLQVLDGAEASFRAQLTVGDAGVVINPDGSRAPPYFAGSGTVRVSGQGSILTLTASSDADPGTLTIGAGGAGKVTVSEDGMAQVAGLLNVGQKTSGRLDISSGGTLIVGGRDGNGIGATLGVETGVQGDVRVSGNGSTLTVNAGMQVGESGTGTLSVLDGATANLGLSTTYSETLVGFGYYATGVDGNRTGSGTISVDGAGSTLNYGGGMNVLNGALNVSGGGQLNSVYRAMDGVPFWVDELGMGLPSDGAGFATLSGTAVATITGAGSAWNSLNGLSIGDGGDGALRVLDGASATFHALLAVGDAHAVRTPDGTSAPYLAGSGNVWVSGQGSTLTLAASSDADPGTLTIGAGGAGVVTVSDGGAAQVAGLLNVGQKTNGRLYVSSGGTVTVGGRDASGVGATLGVEAGARGDVTVTGNG